jgi:hypothetical protein
MRNPSDIGQPHPGDWVRAHRELVRVEEKYFDLLARASRGEVSREQVREAEGAVARQRELSAAVTDRLSSRRTRRNADRPRC